jgi:hypothetical protein
MMGAVLIVGVSGRLKSMEPPLNVGLTPFILTLSNTDSTVAVMFGELKNPPMGVRVGNGGAFGLSVMTMLGSLAEIF